MSEGGQILQLEWDMATVTAADYTVECRISKEAYQKWQEARQSDPTESHLAEGVAFRRDLKAKVEEAVNLKLAEIKSKYNDSNASSESTDGPMHRGKVDEFEPARFKHIQQLRIAAITLSYDNSQLLKLLKVRGSAIAHNKFDKMQEVNDKI